MDYTNITENNKKILIIAHHVAKKHNSFFVGTEHYLLALLENEGSLAAKCSRISKGMKDTNQADPPKQEEKHATFTNRNNNQFRSKVTNWLEATVKMNLSKLKQDTKQFYVQTASSSPNHTMITSLYSSSLSRSLELSIALTDVVGSEHLLLGILLAASVDKIPNAASTIIKSNTSLDLGKSALELLLSDLCLSREHLKGLPKRKLHHFDIHWGDSITLPPNQISCSLPDDANDVKRGILF